MWFDGCWCYDTKEMVMMSLHLPNACYSQHLHSFLLFHSNFIISISYDYSNRGFGTKLAGEPFNRVQLYSRRSLSPHYSTIMILTFQTCFPTVDEEQRFADINVPPTRRVDDVLLPDMNNG